MDLLAAVSRMVAELETITRCKHKRVNEDTKSACTRIVMTHRTSSMAREQNPAEGLGSLVGHIDDSGNVPKHHL